MRPSSGEIPLRRAAVNPDGFPRRLKAMTTLTEQTYDEALLAAEGLVMVDFWAEWCEPCRAVAPVLEEIAEASDGDVTLLKVNVDENPALARRYEIRSIPTILFIKDGEVVERVVGAMPRHALETIVTAHAA
jgi:thioredoxin 1